jgi:hypothetical protein
MVRVPAIHGVVRWRLTGLAQWVFDEFRVSISKQMLSRALRTEIRRVHMAHH